jgi:hypothetical protein
MFSAIPEITSCQPNPSLPRHTSAYAKYLGKNVRIFEPILLRIDTALKSF